MLTFELPIALPDYAAVLVSAVPYLGTIVFPAITADDLCDDQVDLPGQRVLDHPIEAVPVLCVQSADPFIRVHIHKLPIRIRANEAGVVIHLCFIGSKLLLAI